MRHVGAPSGTADETGRAPPFWESVTSSRKALRPLPNLWGDGFVDDPFSSICRVEAWAQCSAGEYIRVFPHLLAKRAWCNELILAHLMRCVAAHAWCESSQSLYALASLPHEMRAAFRPSTYRDWFPDPSRHEARAGRDSGLVLAQLDRLLLGLVSGTVPDLGTLSTADFAFHTGLHPAYLWPSALCTADRDTAAGWLGIVQRGWPALMPLDVAHYVLDVIVDDGTQLALRDSALAGYVDSHDLDGLRRGALQRRNGYGRAVRAVDRNRPARVNLWSLGGSLTAASMEKQ